MDRSQTKNVSFSSSSNVSGTSISSQQKTCAICLASMKAGEGQAIFTAECSHAFHFSCIASNVKHGNRICPVCRSTWKDVPFQSPASTGARVTPVNPPPDEFVHAHPNRPPPEPQNFSDDEPLLQLENSLTLTSSVTGSSDNLVTIRAFTEFPAVLATDSPSAFAVLVGMKAPTLTEGANQNARAPVDLVVVLDVSGSMKGTKLTLLKRAVRFVIYNLGPADRLSIVSFSSRARRVFPLRRMSDTGREGACVSIDSLISSGGTNIVEGLKKGVKVLEDRRERNPVASIILLSDGKDNFSIEQVYSTSRWISYYSNLLPSSICRTKTDVASESTLPPIPVHTFGIGVDHDAGSMHAISDVSGGTFSFIQDANIIQDAFARCIGGILSVVAQQLRLTMSSSSPGVRISSISCGKYKNEISNDNESCVVDVGDLYADEEKDFLIQLSVPAFAEQLLTVGCSYTDVFSKQTVKAVDLEINIRRSQTLSSDDKVVCLEVDRQRNRLMVVEGIAEAQLMAEEGDIGGAQAILESRRLALLDSASAQAGDDLCKWLEAELKEVSERMSTQELYEETGRAYTLSGMSSHSWQRTTTRGGQLNIHGGDGYETASMVTMVTKSQTILSANSSEAS